MSRHREPKVEWVEQTPVRLQGLGMPVLDPGYTLPASLREVQTNRLELNSNYRQMIQNYRRIPGLYRERIEAGDDAAFAEMLQHAPELLDRKWVQRARDRFNRKRASPGRPYGRDIETRNMTQWIEPLVRRIQTDARCSEAEAIRRLSSLGLSDERLKELMYRERPRDGTLLPYAVRDPSRSVRVRADQVLDRPVYARPGTVLGWTPIAMMIVAVPIGAATRGRTAG